MELTQEQEVQKSFDAAMDSVNLLNAGQPKDMSDEEWADCVRRNKEHLEIQLDKPEFYEGYDLTPFWDAVGQK